MKNVMTSELVMTKNSLGSMCMITRSHKPQPAYFYLSGRDVLYGLSGHEIAAK